MPTLAERLQVEFSRRRVLYKKDPEGERWITIGGSAAGGKKHAGGTPVRINADGQITAGPKALEGKDVFALKAPKNKEPNPQRGFRQKQLADAFAKRRETIKLSRRLSTAFERLRYGKFVEADHPRDAQGQFIAKGQTLGLSRKDMPQIAGGDKPEFFEYLKNRGIRFGEKTVPVGRLKGTQKDFNSAKIADLESKMRSSGIRPGSSVLASSDGYILDGHHRWLAQKAIDPNSPFNVVQVDLPIQQLLKVAGEFPKSFKAGVEESAGARADFSAIHKEYPPVNASAPATQDKYRRPDGQYTPERQGLHKKIVSHLIGKATPVAKPVVHMMGGGPASGKSSIVNAGFVTLPDNSVAIDPDEVKGQIPDYKAMLDAKYQRAALNTHEESSHISKQAMRAAVEGKYNIVQDGTGDSSIEALAAKVQALRANGHPIIAHYVTVDSDEAVRRANERGAKTGRVIPEQVIRGIHADVSRVFPQAVERGLFDEVSLYDTSGGTPVLVASGKGKELKVHDKGLYDKFLSKAESPQKREAA